MATNKKSVFQSSETWTFLLKAWDEKNKSDDKKNISHKTNDYLHLFLKASTLITLVCKELSKTVAGYCRPYGERKGGGGVINQYDLPIKNWLKIFTFASFIWNDLWVSTCFFPENKPSGPQMLDTSEGQPGAPDLWVEMWKNTRHYFIKIFTYLFVVKWMTVDFQIWLFLTFSLNRTQYTKFWKFNFHFFDALDFWVAKLYRIKIFPDATKTCVFLGTQTNLENISHSSKMTFSILWSFFALFALKNKMAADGNT